jgi:hypothetical protein
MQATFQSLSIEERIEFFVKCQELMLKHHPNSSFVIRRDTLKQALTACQGNIHKYNGYAYSTENICILWNHILVNDPSDMERIFKENAYQPPNPNYNAVSIDFAVFRSMADCLNFVRENKNERIQYVLFIREGKPKLYPLADLLKGTRLQ